MPMFIVSNLASSICMDLNWYWLLLMGIYLNSVYELIYHDDENHYER